MARRHIKLCLAPFLFLCSLGMINLSLPVTGKFIVDSIDARIIVRQSDDLLCKRALDSRSHNRSTADSTCARLDLTMKYRMETCPGSIHTVQIAVLEGTVDCIESINGVETMGGTYRLQTYLPQAYARVDTVHVAFTVRGTFHRSIPEGESRRLVIYGAFSHEDTLVVPVQRNE